MKSAAVTARAFICTNFDRFARGESIRYGYSAEVNRIIIPESPREGLILSPFISFAFALALVLFVPRPIRLASVDNGNKPRDEIPLRNFREISRAWSPRSLAQQATWQEGPRRYYI